MPAQRTLLLLLLVACVALLAGAAEQDPTALVEDQLARVQPISADASPDAALLWLDHVGEILTRVASGALPALPASAIDAVETMGTDIVGSTTLLHSKAVVLKLIPLLPSLWSIGFWYRERKTWEPLLVPVINPIIHTCKTQQGYERAYDALVDATSLMIRFTKDNVFLDGVDSGGAITDARSRAAVEWLASIVARVSTVSGFSLTASQLRAYMNSIPSKRDGMDMTVAFPVYVDTAKYKASDAAALHRFLSKLPPPASAKQSTQ